MGLLSNADSSSKISRLVSAILRWHKIASALFVLIGVGWLGGMFWPAFSQTNYFSENALLPGLVDEQFSESPVIQAHLQGLTKSSDLLDYVAAAMRDARLDVYEQNFTVANPLSSSDVQSHRNVYGILRAPRANGIESLVVASPIDRKFLPGVAIVLALADFCRSQVYWAKDLIFVFTEAQETGMQAWLSGYHDSRIQHIRGESLEGRSGAIQAAVVFQSELLDVTHVDLKYLMVNGQLPNLDLFNLVSRMMEKYGIEATIHRMKNPVNSFSEKGYKRFLTTAAKGILTQATGRPTGLHSVFGQYGIEAVSMVPYKQGRNSKTMGGVSQVRVLEGILRSLNNLLERFHQSFFFYLLASTERFVSIGIYMPALGFLLLPSLLRAACLWIDMSEKDSDGKVDSTVTNSHQPLEKMNSNMSICIPFWLFAFSVGVSFYHLPTLLERDWFQQDWGPSDKLFASAVALMAGVPLLSHFLRGNHWSELPRDFRIVQCIALLQLSLVVGAAGVMNFALGVTLAIVLVPLFSLIAQPKSMIRRFVQLTMLVLVNPLVIALIGSAVYLVAVNPEKQNWTDESGSARLLQSTVELVKSTLTTVVTDSFLFRSWFYGFGCLCVLPTWVLFFSLACM